MPKKNKEMSLQERFGLKAPRKRETLSINEKRFLRVHSDRYKEALKRGEQYRDYETKMFGGSSLPGEAGGNQYFEKVAS